MPVRALLASLLAALLLTTGAVPARGDDWQSANCDALGLSMQVPADWVVIRDCPWMRSITALYEPDHLILMQDTVEEHSYWDARRAHSSIANDIGARINRPGIATRLTGPTFRVVTINGRIYWEAEALAKMAPIPMTPQWYLAVYEMEAFVTGHMFKFMVSFILKTGEGAANKARADLVAAIWSTIRIRPV